MGMSEEITNKLVPKLRFPEFIDKGDWEEKQFGEICKFIRGPFGGALKKEIFVEDGYAIYEQSHAIYDNFDSFRYYITAEKFNELKRFEVFPNDIIMSCSGTMGKFAIVPVESKKGVINQALLKLTVKTGNDLRFIKETLQLPLIQEKLLSQSAGGAIKNVVEVSQIKEIVLNIPSRPEQQKIADCLSSLDDLITTQKQKLEALKTHKKGLMQQLFPAEGETVPKLRFAEFKDSGDWKEKKLKDIGEFTGGGTPSRMNEDFWTGDIPWISSSDLQDDSIQSIKVNRFITNSALEQSATKLVPKNSILIVSRVGVGKLAISRNAICTSQDFTNFTPTNDNLVFLAYYLKLNSKVLLSFSQGMAIMGFTKDDISNLELLLPTIAEQQKIADCLSSLDKLISAQKEKIETLKIHKKGLMQQLFPNINE